ncbi:hypothetical protein CONCODRAFT_79003 [Conidiobolus coronatus NRRL 28638]|uniref:DOMON domain-containing protein n=1 Tax=Conidiobolus coronatus (strain ATCC 28846 / CBS 209.66 / NRRL 28638) TaxID=796925 RepID=A0A137P4X8_CONC2|nr:hypothetical protein CONCODRAFT_79003 [Conidiobolus coronatus NRRL 28638]|eukprot:KXN70072.1 hypothetical protein CONCODRAFT_79003 [Conidiobolus coronatus NRRL 28638]
MYIKNICLLFSSIAYLSTIIAQGSNNSNLLGIKVEYSIAWLSRDSNGFGANLTLTSSKPLNDNFFIQLQWHNGRVSSGPFWGPFTPYNLVDAGYALQYTASRNKMPNSSDGPSNVTTQFNAQAILAQSEQNQDITDFIYPTTVTILVGDYLKKNNGAYNLTSADLNIIKSNDIPSTPGPKLSQNAYLGPKQFLVNDGLDPEFTATGNSLVGIPIGLIIYSIIFFIGSISYTLGHITRTRLRNRKIFRRSK